MIWAWISSPAMLAAFEVHRLTIWRTQTWEGQWLHLMHRV